MANRLALETSPYLLQHKDNPVDWYPWGPEALERARREDKPILLSIGYSSCHWCHVMAHESFEDEAVAARMNRLFINIKVDREERPDLDHIYQTALQMLTRRAGGWPLNVFLGPDQVPFYGGTYFPPQARFNLPGFADLLDSVARAYHERHAEIAEQNASLLETFASLVPTAPHRDEMDGRPIAMALAAIKHGFDAAHGGYGGAPKFPRPAELEFLLHRGDAETRRQVLFTLRKMAEGGLHDQLGGGFYRYSVDAHWAIPHFEKMLYDNGPLLGLYADAWALTGEPVYREAAEGIVDWLTREMRSPEGLFYAALDADSEHEEGRYYVWTPDEVRALLDEPTYRVAALHWGLDQAPNFEDHGWHLVRAVPEDRVAERLGIGSEAIAEHLARARRALFAARQARVAPGRDEKCLTGWNALAIKGLARAARRMDRPDWSSLAETAVDALRAHLWLDGRLLAGLTHGEARPEGFLDDHAFLLDALLDGLQTHFRPADLRWSMALADILLGRFEDPEAGGFYFTGRDHERLIHRDKPGADNATPSGNGVAATALARLGHLLGEVRYLDAAERTLRCHYAGLAEQPAPFPSLLTALAEYRKPPTLVVMHGPPDGVEEWRQALMPRAAAAVVLIAPGPEASGFPFDDPHPGGGRVVAHVCTGVNCLPDLVRMDDLLPLISG